MQKLLKLPLLIAGLCFANAVVHAQQDSAAQQRQARRVELSRTGPYHRLLASLTGDWTYTGTHFLPGDRKISFKGTATRTSVMDDRYFLFQTTGEKIAMPWADGKEINYQDLTIEGYDNEKAKFFLSTVENHWTTGISAMGGSYDSTARAVTFEQSTELNGMKTIKRQVWHITDSSHYTVEIFTIKDRSIKNSEIIYTRK